MIDNASVKIYAPVKSKNSEGTVIKTWGYKLVPALNPTETIRADVQPANLSEAQVMTYGLSNRGADTKKMFFDRSLNIVINSRAYIVSDIFGESGTYYEIKGVNHWPVHGECLMIPVQGES